MAFDLRVECHPDHVSVEQGEDALEIRGLAPSLVREALDEMRGDRSFEEISARSGMPVSQLESLCAQLVEANVLVIDADGDQERRSMQFVYPDDLVAKCEAHFTTWKSRLFSRPPWTDLATGEAPRELFLGWLIENYFFIEAATIRLPVGIAGAQQPSARKLFSKHFSEEFDHHHFFRRALKAAGIDDAMLEAREPLPSTLAICNHMRECGRRDPLAYAACSGFLESTGDDHKRAHEFFGLLARNFDSADGAIVTPIADHARLDEGYQHCGMLRLVAEAIGPVPFTRADAALEAARLLVETLETWSADICRHYKAPEALKSGIRRYRPVESWEETDA